MTFLPIVHRELRAAARRRSTFRVRWWTTVIAMGMTFISLALVSLGSGRNAGAPMFSVLTFYAFGLCLLAGVFFTAHALTEEKREGTLGLLFLTDLKGYDVVLGKFAAVSLNAFYALLALMPMTALPLLLGGVTGAEFWRMALALINALFFSLAAGLCVSACMRDSQKAMGNTLGVLILAAAVLPVVAHWSGRLGSPRLGAALAWLSPVSPFTLSAAAGYPARRIDYWCSLLGSHLVGWGFLTLASSVLPRAWREGGRRAPARLDRRYPRTPAPQTRVRSDLLSANPVRWLRCQELGVQWRAWGLVALWAVGVLVALLADYLFNGEIASSVLAGYAVIPFGFLLKVLFALQACRFFAEGRRNGTLELLLCTPLSDREIIRGQMLALWRSFSAPLVAFVVLLFLPVTWRLVSAVFSRNLQSLAPALPFSLLGGMYAVRMTLDLLAICWVGMALALTMKRPALAPALTILFVLILPSVLWWADILVDLLLIAWGAGRCRQDLRRVIAQQYQTAFPVSLPPPPGVPPVIAQR
jgi:ABC-type transport system involved in multi-copper enzyme maturation permease subunit